MKNAYQIKIYSFYSIFIKKFIQIIKAYFNTIDSVNFFNSIKTYNSSFTQIKIIKLPTKFKKFTVLKAPHINKKSKEQFESRLYKALIYINHPIHNQFSFIKYLKNINLNKKKSFLPLKIQLKHIIKI